MSEIEKDLDHEFIKHQFDIYFGCGGGGVGGGVAHSILQGRPAIGRFLQGELMEMACHRLKGKETDETIIRTNVPFIIPPSSLYLIISLSLYFVHCSRQFY
jgi:hypothetical protein